MRSGATASQIAMDQEAGDRRADRRRPALSLRDPAVFGWEQRPRRRKRMDELTGERVGHRLINSVTFGPRVGQVMSAENAVEPGKHDA